MTRGIELSSQRTFYDECEKPPEKECGEKHTFRVANAKLDIAIDLTTDFDCEAN